MIIIKNDGTVDPFGIKWTGESQFQLLAPTRDISETTYADGEYDFGTELEVGNYQLSCVSNEGLTKDEMSILKDTLVRQLILWRNYDLLIWECDPEKGLYTKISGAVEFVDRPTWIEVNIPLKYQPLWVGVNEQIQAGSGTVANDGTFKSPLVVEIPGTTTNPQVIIGSETMVYSGALAAGDKLVIDTMNMTVKFNGVNALGNYNGVFPKIPPGKTNIIAGSNVTLKWRHFWI